MLFCLILICRRSQRASPIFTSTSALPSSSNGERRSFPWQTFRYRHVHMRFANHTVNKYVCVCVTCDRLCAGRFPHMHASLKSAPAITFPRDHWNNWSSSGGGSAVTKFHRPAHSPHLSGHEMRTYCCTAPSLSPPCFIRLDTHL